jgi:hypothetical protein
LVVPVEILMPVLLLFSLYNVNSYIIITKAMRIIMGKTITIGLRIKKGTIKYPFLLLQFE